MLKAKITFFLTFLLLILIRSTDAQTVHDVWELPYEHGIAAIVEDKVITYEQIRKELLPLVDSVRKESRSEREFRQKMSELYLEVVNDYIDKVLIVKEFVKKEYQMPRTYIENEYDRILIEDFNNDREKFLQYLRSQGKNIREFRKELEEEIIVASMQSQKQQSMSEVSPERIENFYNENKIYFYQDEKVYLRMIMLKPMADEGEDLIRQSTEKIMEELASGASFQSLAVRYSQDSRGKRGGDWGWINREDLKQDLSDVAFDLQVGSYSQPVWLGNQVFILYVEDRREEGIQPLEEVRDRIEIILSNQISRQSQRAWLENLRRDAYIKYY